MTKHRLSPLYRGLLVTTLGLVPAGTAMAEPMIGTTLNRYGLPGARSR